MRYTVDAGFIALADLTEALELYFEDEPAPAPHAALRRSRSAEACAAPTVTRFPHTSGHTTGADPPVEDDERRELVMRELALVVLILVALAVAAGRYGVDSREGFEWSARGRLSGR